MSGDDERAKALVSELVLSMYSGVLEPWTLGTSASSSFRSDAGPELALAQGGSVNLRNETDALRRRRLAAAACFLAIAFAVLVLSHVLGLGLAGPNWIILGTGGLRCVIAAAVAALLLSRAALSGFQVRVIEYVLFGSFTLLMAVSQYNVNIDHLRAHDLAAVTASAKDGVFSVILLMVSYAMFIPNDPRSAAGVVLTMNAAYSTALVLAVMNPEVAGNLGRQSTTVLAGTNILYVTIGSALSIYGAYVLNGLRTQLHEARKFGQYQLGRKLGEGGMGVVYLAEHKLLKRPCALKLIKAGKMTAITVARFEREVRTAARLAHPNIIEIFDYGRTDDGTCYYVMEYLQGMSLADLVQAHGPIAPGRLIYLMRQACAGLAEAHSLGLVHRDLKPANLFVAVRGGESDVVKVLDFGLVKLTHDTRALNLSSEKTVSGTPLFMSPEQIVGDRMLDGRSDIYALGVVMFVALTGKPPFVGDTPFDVMMSHIRDPVPVPGFVRSSLPADLEAVVLRCLAKKPDGRYPNVKALAEALAACKSATEWGANRADAWWASVGMTALEDES